MRKYFLLIIFPILFFSCTEHHEQGSTNQTVQKSVEVEGYVVQQNSLKTPTVILAGKPKVVKAGIPRIEGAVQDMLSPKDPEIIQSGLPEVCIPGSANFSLPKTIPAIISPVLAGSPEVVNVEDPNILENCTENFSSFGKLQGLKTNTVYCITQDWIGSIWLGTAGGFSKYDGKQFTHYTVEEGIRHNDVLSIMIDKNNNIWIGTNGGGVSKFDGEYFTNFSEKEGLKGSIVFDILEDKKGNIWFGTNEGIIKYDGKSFTQYTTNEGLIDNSVFDICEDKIGNLWVGTSGGVSKYDGHSFSNFTVEEGLAHNVVLNIIQDRNGNIWFGTDDGASKYDGNFFSNYSGESLTNVPVYSIFEDKDENLWFGTWGEGIYKYDGKFIHHYSENEGLINDEINCIFQDSNGMVWFGTRAGGAIKYGGNVFRHFTSESGMSNNQVQNISIDKEGNLWCGTWGKGVAKYDGKSFTWFTEEQGLLNDDVRSVLADRNGDLWFGTYEGVSKFDGVFFSHYTEKEGLCYNFVISAFQDIEGNLWFGTEGGGVSKYDGKHFTNFSVREGLTENTVRSIIQDKEGNLWFGTKKGVTKYDPPEDQDEGIGIFTHYTEAEGLPSNNVISLLADSFGNIWIGSFGGGVIKYDGKYFTNYTENEGLSENGVMSILEDENGNIWFGTRRGITKLPKESVVLSIDDLNDDQDSEIEMFKNYTYEDGFFGIGCNTNSICEDNTGTIWIGTNDRLTALNPWVDIPDTILNIQMTGIELFNEKLPWASIEKNRDSIIELSNGVIIDNIHFDSLSKWYNIPENLSLAHDDNFLTFVFIGITTKSPQSVRYKYKLEGLDENWSTVTNQTNASYGSLPDGKYTFRVEAVNREGKWSDEFVYHLIIRPPWWKSKGAYLIYIIGLILGVFIVDRIQTQRVVSRERERARDRELELARKIKKAYDKLNIEHEIVERQKDELELEKNRSDELLLNILPSEVAEELKAKGYADAKYIDEVTVLFTDFQGFTKFSESLSPHELVAEIHECFSEFDKIMQKHGVEKIKTIGDSYMAAGGLPVANQTHYYDVINAAIDIQQFIYNRKLMKQSEGKPFLELRLGVHTGPVVAGIVGVRKFAYDIWGDTVNTASHMEKSGEIGRINISGATYQLIKDKFNCEHRGKISAKSKGMVDMYFVNCD